jgi:hypothetical protein
VSRPIFVALAAAALFAADLPDAHAGGKAPTVKLLSGGKRPRTALRLALKPGSERAVFASDMSMAMTTGGNTMPKMVLPTIVMESRMTIGKRVGGDAARVTFSVDKAYAVDRPGTMAGVIPAMNKAIGAAVGMKGSGVLSTRGITRDAKISLPPGMPPQMRQLLASTERNMEQLSAPFPKSKVGVGARWQVIQTIEEGGMKLRQVVTYELTELRGRKGKLAISLVQTGKPQAISGAGVPSNARLEHYKATGKGTLSFDLDRTVPRSTLTMKADYAVSVAMAGNKQTVSTVMEMTIDVKPK